MLDIQSIRKDFPLLSEKIDNKPIVYLDSTATSLKPRQVVDAMRGYYETYTANVFRGIYKISERATLEYERARETVATFIHAKSEEVIFTRNTSESINLVYYSWAKEHIESGDEIVVSIMEHHSNFVPWQQLAMERNAKLILWETEPNGLLNYSKLDTLITRRTKLLAITSTSNVFGTNVDISHITQKIRKLNSQCLVLVDAAQSVPHKPVNVNQWDADFVAFSGHKMMGPTGIGVLWGRSELLERMKPFLYGGDMISEVHIDHTVWKELPHKFEAGTPHIAGAIGLGAAVEYLQKIGMENVRKHEEYITGYALQRLTELAYVSILGPKQAKDKGGVVAFTMQGVHPHDVAQILDEDNICIRVGFHCAQPLHEYVGCGPSARASFYIYTSKEDIDVFVQGLEKVRKTFA